MQILHHQGTALFAFHHVLQFDLARSGGWSSEPDSDLRPNTDFGFQLPNFIMVWQSCALTCSHHEESTCEPWTGAARAVGSSWQERPAVTACSAGPSWAGRAEPLQHAQGKRCCEGKLSGAQCSSGPFLGATIP